MKKLDTSGITAHDGGFTADGPEAVDVVRCLTLQSSMALNIRTGMIPTRGVTKTKMRDMANAYSGSKAKNIAQALHDLVIWFEAATGKPVTNPLVLEAAGLDRLEDKK